MKRMVALSLVLLLSIESFAAVVSDNDGSAFITKAEFDSLKNNFQSQIDQYNTSIDSKIDGAIASYLAGINLEKQEKKKILTGDWGDVTSLNGIFEHEYQFPDFSGDVFDGIQINWSSNYYNKSIWSFWKLRYNGNINRNNIRNMVSGKRIGQNVDDLVWLGRYLSVREAWTASVNYYSEASGKDLPVVDITSEFWLRTPLNLDLSGYVSTWTGKSASSIWHPSIAYKTMGGNKDWVPLTNDTYLDPKEQQGSVFANVDYGADIDNEHIISWFDDDAWELCLYSDNLFWNTSNENENRTKAWLDGVIKSGNWWGLETNKAGGVQKVVQIANQFTDNDTSSYAGGENNVKIPTIGLINGKTYSKDINQFDKKTIVLEDGSYFNQLSLNEGLVLMPVEDGEKIEWSPSFKDIYINGASANNEVKIALSYKPFTNKYETCGSGETQDINDYVEIDGLNRGQFPVTSNSKVNLKFTADRDGYIYAKWWPNGLSDTDLIQWSADLDMSSCSTYLRIKN